MAFCFLNIKDLVYNEKTSIDDNKQEQWYKIDIQKEHLFIDIRY